MPRLPRLLVAAALLVCAATPIRAQGSEKDAVVAVVKKMFDGMRAKDSTMFLSTWAPGGRLVSIDTRQTPHTVRYITPNEFVAGFGRAPGSLDEKTYEPVVQVDGNVATVWTYYTLHVAERFSHCGYDAFQLAKLGSEWKVTQVMDTRQREGCRHTGATP